MNRKEIAEYIYDSYGTEKESPWQDDPESVIFRHRLNRKWFALIMRIPKKRLGIPGEEEIDVMNVKSYPELIGSLRFSEGFFPAYHMNKTHWITVLLDVVDEDKIKTLLDISYELTKAGKVKHRTEIDKNHYL